jgi:hypothetical protein
VKKAQPRVAKPKKKKGKWGREETFTRQVAEQICELIADGMTLTKICEAKAMPSIRTVQRWFLRHSEFHAQYWQARKLSAPILFDRARDIADNTSSDVFVDAKGTKRVDSGIVNRDRLRVDTLKWAAAKLNPERFGDKVQHTGTNDGPIEIAHIERLTPAEVAAELSKLIGVAEKEMGLTSGGSQPTEARIERIKDARNGILPPAIYTTLYHHERGPGDVVH